MGRYTNIRSAAKRWREATTLSRQFGLRVPGRYLEIRYEELVAQLRSEEIDQVRVKALVVEHRTKMDEMVDLTIARLAEFHRTLTPEQKDKLISKIETFKKWHHRDQE